eukprot:jgi/Chlat1/4815/Chrsp31S04863
MDSPQAPSGCLPPLASLTGLTTGAAEQQQPAPRAVWLDCDPGKGGVDTGSCCFVCCLLHKLCDMIMLRGHDDAMAIILAGHNRALRLLGISTVHGNQSVEKTTVNAQKVLRMAGLDHIPKHCPEIHGITGLDVHNIPPPSTSSAFSSSSSSSPAADASAGGWPQPVRPPVEGKAVNVMFEKISRALASRVALVCVGSLTNAALLLAVYPEVKDMIEVVLMGGCLGIGNTGPVAEFNMQNDPEAAKMVFESSIPVVMIPLEVTHTALVTPDVIASILSSSPTPFRKLACQLLMFFADTYFRVFNFRNPPLHDPCAVAYVIQPQLFTTELLRVDIEVHSELSAGQTVCDVWHASPLPPNVKVARVMDVPAFWKVMLAAIAEADRCSPCNRSDA